MSQYDDQLREFGDLLRAARRAAGLTQESLAERAGLSTRGISDLERGERRAPHRDTLVLLADALGLSVTERAKWELARERHTNRSAPATSRSRDLSMPPFPTPLSPLVGREREIREIVAALRDPEIRLVTLTGPGGIGKTRVSIAVGHAVTASFLDGAYFVELASIRDPALVLPAIAAALGVRSMGGQDSIAMLRSRVADRLVLIVLDNCEQVVTAAEDLSAVLVGCSRLRVLATSRTPLHISGEREYALPPLDVPEVAEESDLWRIRQSAAVELFVQRARGARSTFDLTSENAGTISAICRRLDGLPLPLELAAARIKVLSPDDILARLEEPLALLTGGARDLPNRQRTMRDAIRWSYDLLNPDEQALLRGMSAFVGGWTLEAGTAVSQAGREGRNAVIDHLMALVDQSLLNAHVEVEATTRYDFLETVREFGLEQLEGCGEKSTVFSLHAQYIVDLAEATEPWLRDQRQADGLRRLSTEQGNTRAVLKRALIDGEVDRDVGRRLAVALIWFWFTQNHFREARDWLELAVLDPVGPRDTLWAKAAVALSMMQWRLGETHEAIPLVQAGLDILRTSDEQWHTMFALHHLAHLTDETGDLAAAIGLFQESVKGFTAISDDWGVAYGRSCLGRTLEMSGRMTEAGTLLEQALATFRELGDDWFTSITSHRLADVYFARGQFRDSAALYCWSVGRFAALGDEIDVADGLVCLGRIGAVLGYPEPAARLLGAAQRLHDAYGMTLLASLRSGYNAAIASIRAALGIEQFEQQWEYGRLMTFDIAVESAQQFTSEIRPENSSATL